MKILKYIFASISCILLSHSALAQLSSVRLNPNGTKALWGVTIKGLGEVVVDTYGNIVRISTEESRRNSDIDYKYYSNRNSYEAGKIESIGDVRFTYYSTFNSYEAGKIKSIGDVKFTYYSSFNDYEASKIKSIAGQSISYYSTFNDYEAGKIKSVAGISLNYYSTFNDYEAAKIKSIGRHRYEYFSNFDRYNAGKLKSGETNITIDGINFKLRYAYGFN